MHFFSGIIQVLNVTRGYIAPWAFTADIVNRISPVVNPLTTLNIIGHLATSAAFYEVTKFGVDELVNFIIPIHNPNNGNADIKNQEIKAKNDSTDIVPLLQLPSLLEKIIIAPAIKGTNLSITGQMPIMNHVYGLIINQEKIKNFIDGRINWWNGANQQKDEEKPDARWQDTISPILKILIDLSLYYSLNFAAKKINNIDDTINNVYESVDTKEQFIKFATRLLPLNSTTGSAEAQAKAVINKAKAQAILDQLYEKRKALEEQAPSTWVTKVTNKISNGLYNATIGEQSNGFRADANFRESIKEINDTSLRNNLILIMKKFERASSKQRLENTNSTKSVSM